MLAFINGTIAGLVGVIGYYGLDSNIFLIFGAVVCIFEVILGRIKGNVRSISVEVIAAFAGCLVMHEKVPSLWIGGALGICAVTAFFCIVSLIAWRMASRKQSQ